MGRSANKKRHPAIVAKSKWLELFDKSQWWSADQLSEFQFRHLLRLCAHAYKTVPYYHGLFDRGGITSSQINPGDWHKVPILKRTALQEHEILSRSIPARHGRRSVVQTSGSTGQPVRVYGTGWMNRIWEAVTVRDHLWHGRDFSGSLAVIRYSSKLDESGEGAMADHWGRSTAGLYQTGPSMMFSVHAGIDRQLNWLAKQQADYLLTYPSNLSALLERSEERNMQFERLREVRTISEMVPPELRNVCREQWGVKLVDSYTSQETGYIALQCPDHDHYHIQSESVLVEVLNDEDEPCQPGEIGRVVLTSLHNYASPLIRYEIGDYAEVGEPCPCGRGLPVLKRIVGRQRNMLVLPNGERRWPVTGSMAFDRVISFRQFQMIQHSLEEIEVKLVVPEPVSKEQESELTDIIHRSLGHPFNITFTYHDEIPRSAGGKFEDFKSNIA